MLDKLASRGYLGTYREKVSPEPIAKTGLLSVDPWIVRGEMWTSHRCYPVFHEDELKLLFRSPLLSFRTQSTLARTYLVAKVTPTRVLCFPSSYVSSALLMWPGLSPLVCAISRVAGLVLGSPKKIDHSKYSQYSYAKTNREANVRVEEVLSSIGY